MTQSGLEFIGAGQEELDFLKKLLIVGGFDQIILVSHYPCLVHRHLNKGLKPSARWRKTAERTRENFLKLEEDGVRRLSDREFSLVHLQQQLTYFKSLIPKDDQNLNKK